MSPYVVHRLIDWCRPAAVRPPEGQREAEGQHRRPLQIGLRGPPRGPRAAGHPTPLGGGGEGGAGREPAVRPPQGGLEPGGGVPRLPAGGGGRRQGVHPRAHRHRPAVPLVRPKAAPTPVDQSSPRVVGIFLRLGARF
eukprot:963235-Prorocentrum_minimum.AAC.1